MNTDTVADVMYLKETGNSPLIRHVFMCNNTVV